MEDEKRLQTENQELKNRLRELEDTLATIQQGEVDAIVVKGPKGDQLYSLNGSEYPYKFFIESMGEAAVFLSPKGIIIYANSAFFEMTGYSSEKVIGASILDFVKVEEKTLFMETLENLQEEGKRKLEFCFVRKDRKQITTLLSICKAASDKSENLCLLLTDISKLKQAQIYLEISQSIIKILSEAPNASSAIKLILEILKTYFDWDVVLLWVWDRDLQSLYCAEFNHTPDINIDDFVKKTKEAETGKKLMAAHVWTSFRPYWIEDITDDPTFTRRKEAIKANLKGALAFPFYEEAQLSGVIELFRQTPFREEVDASMQDLITLIGVEIGLYFQRRREEEINYHFATIFKYSENGIYTTNKNAIIKTWNPSAERIYGWTAEEMIGRSIKKIYPDGKLNEYDEILNELHSGRVIEHFGSQRLRKDGKLICVDSTYVPIQDPFGGLTGACVVVHDISFDKERSESLAKSEDKFRSFIEMTEDWIWEIDHAGNFIFSNPAVQKFLGYSVDEVIGKNFFYFLSPDERKKMETQYAANILQKKGWVHQIMHYIHKDGVDSWLESNACELLDEKHELLGFRGVSRDITASKNLEKLKSEFISIVNHELRTPLTTIYGALTLLIGKKLTPEDNKALLVTAQRNSERLTHIINDIMDVEKLQLGKLAYEFKKINIRDVILESINSSEVLAQQNDVKIVSDGLVDAEVSGDYLRLVQVIMNLLSNAIKFSPNKSTINVSMEVKDDNIRISVRDYGKGIPKSFQSKIFDKFAQADSSSKRSYQGTGLGLYISKTIIEGHGGTISYTTEVGDGTTFFFDLPKFKEVLT